MIIKTMPKKSTLNKKSNPAPFKNVNIKKITGSTELKEKLTQKIHLIKRKQNIKCKICIDKISI
jgi:hypothetical protein